MASRSPDNAFGPTSTVDRLSRLLDTSNLAHLVPDLAPGMLHALIQHRGLEACGGIVAAATPEQLVAVLDIDLWRPAGSGVADRFDEDRFADWIEMLVQDGDSNAARIVATIDVNLVTAGLSRYIAVFDPAALAPAVDDDDVAATETTASASVTREVGGCVVAARRTDAWDAIVGLLVELSECEPAYFRAVMQGCRGLSNSTPEADGLDALLGQPEQLQHDVADERAQRRSGHGYVATADARAFLTIARQAHAPRDLPSARPQPVLAAAGSQPSQLTPLLPLLEHVRETDGEAFTARSGELAFLANTLIAGCSVHSRAFTPEEAAQAAAAICNLGLEQWPGLSETFLLDHDLIVAFEAGWAALHQQVSLFVAQHLLRMLEDLRSVDAEIQEGLDTLRRELARECGTGTPWRARSALDVIAILDLPAWAALQGLLDECPVLPVALRAILEGRTGRISATAFEFISTTRQICDVHVFIAKLLDVLLR